MTIKDRVIEIIARQAVLDPSDVALESTPESLGLDSLGIVETIFGIEEAFEISVPFNANDPTAGQFSIANVGAIVAAVERLLTSNQTSAA